MTGRPRRRRSIALTIVGVGLLLLAGLLCGVYELLLVPFRIGTTIAPVSVPLAVASNLLLPRLGRGLVGASWGAMPPVAGWIVAAGSGLTQGPGGDVVLLGNVSDIAIVGYLVLLCGFAAGISMAVRPYREPASFVAGEADLT